MSKRIIIHAGFPKTGSSALQAVLSHIPPENTYYPAIDFNVFHKRDYHLETLMVDFKQPCHNLLFNVLFKDDYGASFYYMKGVVLEESRRIEIRDEVYKKLAQKIRAQEELSTKNIIFSAEHIFHFELHEIERMAKYFLKFSKDITIIAYVRDPTDWARSFFSENLKKGIVSRESYNCDLKKKISLFRELVGKDNVLIRCYSSLLNKESLSSDFYNSLNINAPEIETPQVNVGLSSDAAKVLLRMEKLQEVYSRANVVSNRAFRDVVTFVLQTFAQCSPLEKQYFTAIADYSDVDYLKKEFGIEYKRPKKIHSIDSFFKYLTNLNSISTDSKFFTEIVIPTYLKGTAENHSYNGRILNNLLSSNFIEHKKNDDQVPIDLYFQKIDDLGKLIDKKLSLLLMLNCIHTYTFLRNHYEKNGFL